MNDVIALTLDKLGLDKLPCPIKFTNQNLRFFELGAYFETQDECWIEINPKIDSRRLGYDLEIILMHEIIHAMRKNFKDSFIEELIAYHVCKKNYQRFLGPFFSKKLTQCLIFTLPIAVLFSYALLVWSLFFLILFCGHIYEYRLFHKAFTNLKMQFKEESLAFSDLLKRDKDDIIALAKEAATSVRNF